MTPDQISKLPPELQPMAERCERGKGLISLVHSEFYNHDVIAALTYCLQMQEERDAYMSAVRDLREDLTVCKNCHQTQQRRAETAVADDGSITDYARGLAIDYVENALSANVALDQPPTCQMCKEIMVRNLMQSSVAGFHCRKCGASAAAELPPPRDPHKTIRVQVWADVDEGIADLVIYLNTIAGVYTDASCQGTIGEGGPHPYGPQVMAHWIKEVEPRLQAEFDITFEGECWGYIHPREGWKTRLASTGDTPQPQDAHDATIIVDHIVGMVADDGSITDYARSLAIDYVESALSGSAALGKTPAALPNENIMGFAKLIKEKCEFYWNVDDYLQR